MEYTHSEGPWVETAVRLVVRKPDLDADFVSRAIPLPPTSVRHPGSDHRNPPTSEDGLWVLQVHDRMPGGISDQLRTLLETLEPHSSALTRLADQGYDVHVALSGFVGRGATFVLPPELVRRAAALGVPVTVTTSVSDR
ncbi:DUF4279 domain-containing protein [Streptomyces sp. NPDC086182]|jgi:hypothetical protein|uniref:DUF4279 domain-containing protein n=1 Tax=Streptomyces sp. NPDC086182 TaxID=3155058 RepID=UPI003441D273